jgi:NADH-quinone oxidoreductase subunit M
MPAGPLLSILIFLPAFGALALLFLRSDDHEWIRRLTFAVSLAEFFLSVWWLLAGVPLGSSGYRLEEFHPWIALGPHHDLANTYINYHLGVDGISLWLVILTTFLTVVSVLCSWSSIQKRVKEFFIMLLLLEVGVVGVFLSLDLFLFFLFWEVMLIPMYFLIGIWGHDRRIYAAVKFVLYTMAGSILMLVGIVWLYNVTGTFDLAGIHLQGMDLPGIQGLIQNGVITLAPKAETLLFLAFFLAFAIKVPLFPFHTWLPDAHVEAPTAGSVMLAGILLKMGTYGMIRFCLPLFPNASHRFAPAIAVLALIGIIYGALVSLVQPNLKKIIAYSSVSHLGFVVLGIFAFHIVSMQGAVFQMLAHGVSTGGLFLLVGMIYDRRHTYEISQFGGLATPMPRYAAFFSFIVLSSLGLPMLNGFVGEFMILLGTYQKHWNWATFGAIGVILSACYLLWAYQRVFFGEITVEKNRTLPDISARERAILVTMAVVILWMGIGSFTITSRTQNASQLVLDQSQVPPRAYEVSAPSSTGTPACASRPVAQPIPLVAQPTAFSSRAFSRRVLAVLPDCPAAPPSSSAPAKQNSLERLGTR